MVNSHKAKLSFQQHTQQHPISDSKYLHFVGIPGTTQYLEQNVCYTQTKVRFFRFLSREKNLLTSNIIASFFSSSECFIRTYYLNHGGTGILRDLKEKRIPPAEKRTPLCTSVRKSVK